MIMGHFHLVWWAYMLTYMSIGFLVAEIASLLTTVYLHRGSTHRSLKFNPVLEFLMQLGLWLTTGINRKEWVAVHLCHHAHADVEGDPHSPILLGLWPVQLGNIFLYRRAARDPKTLWYGRNIVPTFAERIIFRWTLIGPFVVAPALLWWAFGLLPMLIIVATHMLLYLFLLNNLVNGLCHYRGYKNFPLPVVAFNNHFVAWITMGEGFHNNHHNAPGNPSLSYKWYEFDLGWVFIRLMCFCGLIKIARAS
jgi:stearoyl-CoA desaturase (delta-9 desaturase)